MPFSRSAKFDPLRSVAFGSISATYVALGTAFTHMVRGFRITNQTDGDLFIAITNGSVPASDGTADNLIVPAAAFVLWDVATDSSHLTNDPAFVLAKGDQVWVRQSTAPTVRSVYLECLTALGE